MNATSRVEWLRRKHHEITDWCRAVRRAHPEGTAELVETQGQLTVHAHELLEMQHVITDEDDSPQTTAMWAGLYDLLEDTGVELRRQWRQPRIRSLVLHDLEMLHRDTLGTPNEHHDVLFEVPVRWQHPNLDHGVRALSLEHAARTTARTDPFGDDFTVVHAPMWVWSLYHAAGTDAAVRLLLWPETRRQLPLGCAVGEAVPYPGAESVHTALTLWDPGDEHGALTCFADAVRAAVRL